MVFCVFTMRTTPEDWLNRDWFHMRNVIWVSVRTFVCVWCMGINIWKNEWDNDAKDPRKRESVCEVKEKSNVWARRLGACVEKVETKYLKCRTCGINNNKTVLCNIYLPTMCIVSKLNEIIIDVMIVISCSRLGGYESYRKHVSVMVSRIFRKIKKAESFRATGSIINLSFFRSRMIGWGDFVWAM